MPTARRRTGGIAGTENPSADSHDPVVAELRTMVATLKTRIAILEESERKHRETTHQLGLDVVTLGQTLNNHIRAGHAVPAERPSQDDAPRASPAPVPAKSSRRGKARVSGLGSMAGPALAIAGLLILLVIILSVLPLGQRNRNLAPPRKAASHTTAIVVLGDSSNVALQEPAAKPSAPVQNLDQTGHVLYAPPATTP